MSNTRPNEIPNLQQFTGTEIWWKHSLYPKYRFTDGIKYVAETAQAYWLLEMMFSHTRAIQRNNSISEDTKLFLVFNLSVSEDNTAAFTTTDGNINIIKQACQGIPFTDFPAKKFTCWMTDNVCLLPSEY